ncbi:YfbM family protein [Nostoc sp. C117]|uniref:YfbM family protein n=1 Tax=Nostoc sp. C117 TaxID=3349875 RepID=UPI00370D10B6
MMLAYYRQMNFTEFKKIKESRIIQENLIYSDSTESPYGDCLCIGIWWGAIDFLLVGPGANKSNPLKKLVFGGTPLDADDIWFDFGPIRYLEPDEVREISELIVKISPEMLIAQYNVASLIEHQVPPDTWLIEDQSKVVISITSYYSKIVDFFQKAARIENYILAYITA